MDLQKDRRPVTRDEFLRPFDRFVFIPFDVDLEELRNDVQARCSVPNAFDPDFDRLWCAPHRIIKPLSLNKTANRIDSHLNDRRFLANAALFDPHSMPNRFKSRIAASLSASNGDGSK